MLISGPKRSKTQVGKQVKMERQTEHGHAAAVNTRRRPPQGECGNEKELQFSLFYFDGKGSANSRDKYRLLIEGAKFADDHAFCAVWTPERHFHPFGGMYPNPSVTSAALAMVTKRVCLRAGSVVAPLHQFARIAEEWALVDNLSGGRIGVSFASGWHADDFALYPSRYVERKEKMVEAIETIQRLWKGDRVPLKNGSGRTIEVQSLPRPLQKCLPMWVTCSGNPETFELAGRLGTGVLTHLLGQSVAELEAKIRLYRQARIASGHSGMGQVTLMLHTFIGKNTEAVREKIREPFLEYLHSSLGLIQRQLQNHAAGDSLNPIPWRRSPVSRSSAARIDMDHIDEQSTKQLVAHTFDRYFESAALFGSPEKCLPLLQQVYGIGINEIACLIDFGVDVDSVLKSLTYLNQTKDLYRKSRTESELAQLQSFNDPL